MDFGGFERDFEGIAKELCSDYDIQQDLIQEMRIKVWGMDNGHTSSYYLRYAKNVAINYLVKYYPGKEIPFSQLSERDRISIRDVIDLGDEDDE